MNFLPRALCVFLLAATAVFAQRSNEPEIDDYVPTVDDDLVVYIPKNAVRLGFRGLSGATSGFSGQGLITSKAEIGSDTGVEARLYHDGFVGLDGRKVADPSGVLVPIAPDGRTNTWGYDSLTQITEDGFLRFNDYSANVIDTSVRTDDPGIAFGVEIATEREFGGVFGTRMKWGVVVGLSVNQILATAKDTVQADITTVTDFYSLYGQMPPAPPFTGPNSTGTVDNSPLLGNELLLRETTTTTSSTAVLSNWKLRGAYMTFRAGPTLLIPITKRFSASLSAGGVLVFSGSSYKVDQSFTPATGQDIVRNDMESNDTALLPGYYFDASLQFDFTDNAGLYLGGVYQSSGDYEQEAVSADGKAVYKARVDLASLQGIRAGVTFKF